MEMTTLVRLFRLDEIREMMGATEPIEGCMIVMLGTQRKQIAFSNEQPPDDAQWQWFEYETEPHDCLPIFDQKPVYGVLIGDVEPSREVFRLPGCHDKVCQLWRGMRQEGRGRAKVLPPN
jgi:hypothetical protein